ncbi:MAG: leucine-rich repeat domain-containing protein, partial [Holosporales bacterium]|nr:leucine-rich repeat domain-containing protein [Holosporales bacterium]
MNDTLRLKKILLFSCLFNAGGYCNYSKPAASWVERVRREILIPEEKSFFVVRNEDQLRELGTGSVEKLYIRSNVRIDRSFIFPYGLEYLVIEGGPLQKPCFSTNWYLKWPNLRTLVLGVDTLEDGAFRECRHLETVLLSGNLREIPVDAFYYCRYLREINIPSSVTTIGAYAFSCCTCLQKINIPSRVTTIDRGAFYSCTSLREINIPSRVTTIGAYAFHRCTSLREINIPPSVTTIDRGAFRECTSLREINIPSSVTTIGDNAFAESGLKIVDLSECNRLCNLTCDRMLSRLFGKDFLRHRNPPDGCEVIFPGFKVWRFDEETKTWGHDSNRSMEEANKHGYIRSVNDCESLSERIECIHVASGVKLGNLGVSPFRRFTALKRVIIESNASQDSIPDGCFIGCSNLEKIVIPDNI